MKKELVNAGICLVVVVALFGLIAPVQAQEMMYTVQGTVYYHDMTPVEEGVTVSVTDIDMTHINNTLTDTTSATGFYQVVFGFPDMNFVTIGNQLQVEVIHGALTNTTTVEATGSPQAVNLILEGGEVPPTCTVSVSNTTITPPQTTDIHVEFSERVNYAINIENETGFVVYDWTGTRSTPIIRTWDGTYEGDGVVPDGIYTVNVTMESTATGLTAFNNSKTITVSIPEEEPELTTIVVLPASVILNIDDTQQFTATGYDQHDNEMTGIAFDWSSSNTTVGIVDGNGLFTALELGSTIITATNGTIVGSASVTVSPINILDFTVDATVERGHTLNATVTIKNEGSSTLNNVTIVVSGLEIFGYPLVGTGAIANLVADQEITLRMLVYVPASADIGSYDLYANTWLYEDYPDVTKAIKSDKGVTEVTS